MLGKNKVIKSILIAFGILGASSAALAALPGFNVGIQAGLGRTEYSAKDIKNVTTARITDKTGFAGRIYAGYNFDQNWGAELGFTQFQKTEFKNIGGTGLNGSVRHQAVDLAGKGIYSFGNGFDVFGKLGAAYVKAQTSGALSGSKSRIQPVLGAGVTYDITPNVPVELAYTRFQKAGGKIASSNLFTLGLAYNFG